MFTKCGLISIVLIGGGDPFERRTGRTADWLKFKNPAAPAVQREAEEDWGGRGRR
jgi:hypothetical protein